MYRATALAFMVLAVPALAAEPTVTVSATGTAIAKPDMATLRLGVRRQAQTARAALDGANTAMGEILAAMAAFGIAQSDLQTSDLQIQPLYSENRSPSPGEEPTVTGYAVTNVLTVRVRDIAKAGEVLDKAVSLGVNTDGGISFSNANPEPIIERARRDAVRRATDAARTLADAAGTSLGSVRTVREGTEPGPPRFMQTRAESMVRGVPIAPGENSYSVSITMEWSLTDAR